MSASTLKRHSRCVQRRRAVMSLEFFEPACVRCIAELHRHFFNRCSELKLSWGASQHATFPSESNLSLRSTKQAVVCMPHLLLCADTEPDKTRVLPLP